MRQILLYLHRRELLGSSAKVQGKEWDSVQTWQTSAKPIPRNGICKPNVVEVGLPVKKHEDVAWFRAYSCPALSSTAFYARHFVSEHATDGATMLT